MKYKWTYDKSDDTWMFGDPQNGGGVYQDSGAGYRETPTKQHRYFWSGNVVVNGDVTMMPTYPTKEVAMEDVEREFDELSKASDVPNWATTLGVRTTSILGKRIAATPDDLTPKMLELGWTLNSANVHWLEFVKGDTTIHVGLLGQTVGGKPVIFSWQAYGQVDKETMDLLDGMT